MTEVPGQGRDLTGFVANVKHAPSKPRDEKTGAAPAEGVVPGQFATQTLKGIYLAAVIGDRDQPLAQDGRRRDRALCPGRPAFFPAGYIPAMQLAVVTAEIDPPLIKRRLSGDPF